MAKNRESASCRITVRFTPAERSFLERKAAGRPISDFVRDILLTDCPAARKPRNSAPIKDREAVARMLGELGKSRIANNLNQLAKEANQGNLLFSDEVKVTILEACADVRAMRNMNMRALGLSED